MAFDAWMMLSHSAHELSQWPPDNMTYSRVGVSPDRLFVGSILPLTYDEASEPGSNSLFEVPLPVVP